MRVGSSRSRPIGASIRPGARARPPRDEREVRPLERALADERRSGAGAPPRERATTSRPGRVAVEPVDDPGPPGLPAGELARRARRRACRSRARRPDGRRGPAGLSTTSRCSSSPDDRAASARRRAAPGAGVGGRELDLLAALEPVALRPRAAVDERARLDRALGRAARAERASREEAVEPLARRLGRNDEHGPLTERAATSSVPPRLLRPAVARRQRAEQDRDADHDEAVGEVERRPPAEVDEVGHVAEADAVDEVRDAAADQQAERRPGSTGCRAPERAKKTSIQTDGDRRQRRSRRRRRREEAEGDARSSATRWIESGPSTCADSSRRERGS